MGEHLFFKTTPQVLLSWCQRPPASSTCATSFCALPLCNSNFTSFEEKCIFFVHTVFVLGETGAV